MAEYTAPSLPATPPLVGREHEQANLRDALASAMAGRGSLVLVGGEAGIGKTALAEATLAEASAQGCTVHLLHPRRIPGTRIPGVPAG